MLTRRHGSALRREALAFVQAMRVAATRMKVLSGERQRGMWVSCLHYPLLCRNAGGERHMCVSMTAWLISQVLALVLFLVLSIVLYGSVE
jgi:hypothetical protein